METSLGSLVSSPRVHAVSDAYMLFPMTSRSADIAFNKMEHEVVSRSLDRTRRVEKALAMIMENQQTLLARTNRMEENQQTLLARTNRMEETLSRVETRTPAQQEQQDARGQAVEKAPNSSETLAAPSEAKEKAKRPKAKGKEPQPETSVALAEAKEAEKCSWKPVLIQSTEGDNQEEPVMNPLAPVACTNSYSDEMDFGPGPAASSDLMEDFDMWITKKDTAASRYKEKDIMGDGSKVTVQSDMSFAAIFYQDRRLDTLPYRTEDFFKTTGWVQALVRSDGFQNLNMLVVCVNAVWLGIAQEYNVSVKLYDSQPVFIIVETLFCTYFTIELALQFMAFTSARNAFRDGWFRFDLFMVVTMILDTWVIMVIMQVMDGNAFRLPIAPFRTLRVLKLTRMARLMQVFPELITMIRSMVRAVRAVASMCILVTLLLYVWAIIMNTLLGEEKELNDRLFELSQVDFSDLRSSMWTLFLNGALLLDNSAPLLTLLVFGETLTHKIAGALLLVFIFLSAFLILQMLTGIFCDVVIQVREENRNEEDVRLIKQELTGMLTKIDNGDGHLAQKEVHEFVSTGKTKSVLKQMGINLMFLYQQQEILFERQSRVRIRDFLELMMLCRSSNQATVETLAGGFCFIGKEMERLHTHLVRDVTEGLCAKKTS